jgi:hypothetical protein
MTNKFHEIIKLFATASKTNSINYLSEDEAFYEEKEIGTISFKTNQHLQERLNKKLPGFGFIAFDTNLFKTDDIGTEIYLEISGLGILISLHTRDLLEFDKLTIEYYTIDLSQNCFDDLFFEDFTKDMIEKIKLVSKTLIEELKIIKEYRLMFLTQKIQIDEFAAGKKHLL